MVLDDFDLLTLAEVASLLHCSKAHVSHAVAGRAKIAKLVTELGLRALPSATNFVTVEFPASAPLSAPAATAKLAERGILVRGLEPYGMNQCLRISVCTDGDWPAVEAALRAVIR